MPIRETSAGPIYFTDRPVPDPACPPLVLVHGAGGSRLDWPPQLRRLDGVRVIALDLPGHDRSAPPGRTDTLDYARAVIALLDALDIRQAVIAGHSMGGAIAQQIALHVPERAAGLILIATGSKLPVDPALPQRIIDEPERTIDWIVERSWGPEAAGDMRALSRDRLRKMPPAILRGDYVACQRFDVRDQLDQIAVPTLVIGSAGDNMVPLKFSITLAERIPRVTLVTLDGAGHMIPLERPDAVAGAVRRWLKETLCNA